ncbi:hypothetical protein BDV93DRAFT_555924 [Ceratobasidium sp. AG-I]|nr:hypothetical protein BDV93DRAFT_555924 [Ceratobasidium sp. AG-I]
MSAPRQQPSRTSCHSLQSGPDRINAQYQTISQAQSVCTPEIEITQVDSGPIASPTAQRIIPPLVVPGAYNTSQDQAGPSHQTTIEVVADPDEPTIRQLEPRDMSVLPTSPRPAQRPVPVFTQPSQIEDNLHQELGARLTPLAETNCSIQVVQRTGAEAMERIARLNKIKQNANNELTLIRENSQQACTEIGYVNNQIWGMHNNIQNIQRVQQEQGEDIRRILVNMDHFNEQLANLNILIQEEVGGLHEQLQVQGSFNPQGHSTQRNIPRPESQHLVRRTHSPRRLSPIRRIPSPHRLSPIRRIPSPRRLLPRQEEEEIHLPKDTRQKCPDPFNGKKGSEVETFMLCLEMFFDKYPQVYSTNRRRIKKLLSTMKEGTSTSTWA